MGSTQTALVKVRDDFAGVASITVGATAVGETSTARQSAIDLWLRVVRLAEVQFGGAWKTWVDDAGKINIVPPSTATISATGDAESYLGLSGSLVVSASTVGVFPSRMSGAIVPSYGLSYSSPDLITNISPVTSSANASTRAYPSGVDVSFDMWDTLANTYSTTESTLVGNTYDATRDGDLFARIMIRGVRRARWGSSAEHAFASVDAVTVKREEI